MRANGLPGRIGFLAWITLAGSLCFVLTILMLHGVQPDLNPLDEAMSYYVHGAYGWLLTVGLFMLGLGSLALTVALNRALGRQLTRSGQVWLAVWGVGVLLGAFFAADPPGQWDKPPSISGSIHGLAAVLALVSFPVAALLLTRRLRADVRWSGLSAILLILALASAGSLVAFMLSLVPVLISPGPPRLLGLTERILFAVYVAWISVVAVSLLRSAAPRHVGQKM